MPSNLGSTFQLSFVLNSTEYSASELAVRLGLPADRSWHKDELLSPTRATRRKHSGIEISGQLPASAPVDTQLRELIAQLEPHADRIGGLLRDPRPYEERPTVGCIWVFGSTVAGSTGIILDLDDGLIATLARMGVSLEFEISPECPDSVD